MEWLVTCLVVALLWPVGVLLFRAIMRECHENSEVFLLLVLAWPIANIEKADAAMAYYLDDFQLMRVPGKHSFLVRCRRRYSSSVLSRARSAMGSIDGPSVIMFEVSEPTAEGSEFKGLLDWMKARQSETDNQ